MKELSIFIDESGDFGDYDFRSPYYILSMVFHDQSIAIIEEIKKLENALSHLGLPGHCVHAGPVIRQEAEYRFVESNIRVKILKYMVAFVRKINIRCMSFHIEKKHIKDEIEATGKLSKEISRFIKENYGYFMAFDKIKIYYDNGQVEVNKMLSAVFNVLLDNVEFKKVVPSDYRLFQVADLVCTLKLTELKMNANSLSKSEKNFFESERILKKNYLKPIHEKLM